MIALAGFLLVRLWRESLSVEPEFSLFSSLYAVLGLYFLEAVTSLFLLRFVRRTKPFVVFQIGVDLLMVGIMVASTGGSTSLFCPLFFASVLAASTVLDLEGSILCSSSATVILAAASIVPHMVKGNAPSSVNPWALASYLFTYALSLHGVSLLSARLVGGLTEAMNLTEEIVETMGEGLIATGKNGRILVFNREARKLLGISEREEPEGKTIRDILTGENLEACQKEQRCR